MPSAGGAAPDYAALWRWSNDESEAFWAALWDYAGVIGTRGERSSSTARGCRGQNGFPTRVSISPRTCSRAARATPAIAGVPWRGQARAADVARRRRGGSLAHCRCAEALGVKIGDVAAYVPNMPEAIVAMLGAASQARSGRPALPISACKVFSTASGRSSRASSHVDGYWYNGKALSIVDKVAEIAARLPSVERVVVIPYLEKSGLPPPDQVHPQRGALGRLLAGQPVAPIDYVRLPFDHPLYILYSSAPPACRSASSTARAARCSSTSRNTCCTAISRQAIDCSISRRAAG
jgi:acetoacetyl-CoA synthetase